MKRRQFLLATAGTLAAPAFIRSANAQDAEFTLKLHHFLSPKAPAQTKMFEPWAERIAEDTNGRVKIEMYPSMSLGGSAGQLFRQAVEGVVDIIWVPNSYTPGLFPRTEAFELPTVYTNDIAATNLAMRQMHDEYLAPEFEYVHLLFPHVHAGQAIHMAKDPVHTIDDMQGKKIRVPGVIGGNVVEAMGATQVTMPVPQMVQALSTNEVDGALVPWEIIPAVQLQEVTQYQIEGPNESRFGTTTFQVSMNKDRWNSLPADVQDVFNRHCGEDWLREVADIWRASDDHGIQVATDAGNEHIVLTDEEWATFDGAMNSVVDNWLAEHEDIGGSALVEAAKAAIKANAS